MNIYENQTGLEQIINENIDCGTFKVDKITINGGIKQWIKTADFPRRGMCPQEVMFACNQAKKLFIESIKVFSSWQFILAIIFTKDKLKFVRSYNEIAWKIMNPYIIKYEYLNPLAQELQDLSYNFLIKLNLDEENSKRFSKIFSHLIEYDDAYRFRVQDIFSESNKYLMIKHSRQELKKLSRILIERDLEGVSVKFERLIRLISFILLIPGIKRVFVETFEDSNFDKLQVDDTDFYWHCMREDYKFRGMTNDERKEYMEIKGWNIPQKMKV